MASLFNRSNYIVEVAGEPALAKKFPYDGAAAAARYQREVTAQVKTATVSQLEDTILVRIRTKGFPEHSYTATSYEDAEREVLKVTSDRAQGKRADYNKARRITLAALMHKYTLEECPSITAA